MKTVSFEEPLPIEQGKTDNSRISGYPLSSSVLTGIFGFTDCFLLVVAGFASYSIVIGDILYMREIYVFAICFIAFCYLFIGRFAGIFSFSAILSPFISLSRLSVCCATAFFLLLAVAFSLKISDNFSRIWMYSFGFSSFTLVVVSRIVGFFVVSTLIEKGLCKRNVIIFGAGPQAERLMEQLTQHTPSMQRIVGIFDDRKTRNEGHIGPYPILGNMDQLKRFVRTYKVDDIIIALPWTADERQVDLVRQLRELPTHIHLVSDLVGFRFPNKPSPNHFGGVPMIEVVDSPLSDWKVAIKWLEDRILGTLLLILSVPVLLAIAIAIKLESKGPVLFKQKRFGYNNQIFEIYKFRSMYTDCGDAPVTVQASKNDPRITRVGRIIRRTSLDELPQLLNVVLGTMSLVGPRPHAVDHNEEYAALIDGYFARHKVKPGITGWAQVNGYRGETNTLDKMEARVQHDTYYCENWSLMFDLQILVMTAFVGFVHRNAY
ncbi:undecaprenyl-phosphate glucose phosphotransferase [Sneathiella chinensis]|uniref:Undecaprenyl-phosphate glucose phosphotransferase n=1 Tax=Sneathiella chinensis TaxID=349750 RepID=A0ABQ5U715_9PROT|nr:undecaprenyl-phosphate glucose phosphotransferase [Sneathiella chinensis]GLQ07939.1 undecaprenyl-phosphate glucose phosphotransferase [Sneathiella chinensis]